MAANRKRVDLDLSVERDILQQVDNNVKRKDIADKYCIIDLSTVSKLVKSRDHFERLSLCRSISLQNKASYLHINV